MGDESEVELLQWQSFMQQVHDISTQALALELPNRLVGAGLLMCAARYFVIEAKVQGCDMPKIGPMWNRWVEQERERVEKTFGRKEDAA
jgi:hypothetical protein